MKAIFVITLSLLVLIDGHRYRPYKRPNRFRRSSRICRSNNPCGGSFFLYKEIVVPSNSNCPTFTGGGFGRSASSEVSNSNSASTLSESSEESVGSNEGFSMESTDSLEEVSNGSISNEEEERHYGYGGGFKRLRRICVSIFFLPIFNSFCYELLSTSLLNNRIFFLTDKRHNLTICFLLFYRELLYFLKSLE